MKNGDDSNSETAIEARPTPPEAVPAQARDGSGPPPAVATAHPDPRPRTRRPIPCLPRRPGVRCAIAPLAEGVAVGGGRGRPGLRRLRPGADRQDDDGDGLHRRRLRQRPRDLRGPPGRRPGEPGPGGRQRPGEQGGPAGPARQGAVPGPGRPQEGGRRQRGGRRGGRAGPGPGHPGPGPEPALEAPEGDRGRRRQGGAAQGPGRGPAGQGGDPRPRQGRLRPSHAAFQQGRDRPRGVRPAP